MKTALHSEISEQQCIYRMYLSSYMVNASIVLPINFLNTFLYLQRPQGSLKATKCFLNFILQCTFAQFVLHRCILMISSVKKCPQSEVFQILLAILAAIVNTAGWVLGC